jgi:hypothetical protein
MWNLPPLSLTILQAWRMAGAKEVGPASRTDEISCLISAARQQQQQKTTAMSEQKLSACLAGSL